MKSIEILKEITKVLGEIEERIKGLSSLSPKKKEQALNKIRKARENFFNLIDEVVIDNEELASFFLKRAVRLKNSTNNKTIEKLGEKEYMKEVDAILKYSRAAPYDFTNRMKYVNRAYKAYIYGLIPFFILGGLFGPQFAITSLILVIPILLSVLSLRKRGYTGLMLAFAVLPIPILMGAFAIRYALYALTTPGEIQQIVEQTGKSLATAQGLVILMLVLGIIDITLLTYAGYMFYKNRHAFL